MLKSQVLFKLCVAVGLGLALALVLLGSIASPSAQAATLTVGTGGDYPTIQQAIQAARPGDEIRVRDEVFSESLVIAKSLTLLGGYDATFTSRVPRTTLISPTGRAISITGTALSVSLDGFEIANASVSGAGAGIYVDVSDGSRVVIHDNHIHHNTAIGGWEAAGGGLWADLDNRSDLYVTHNDIISNSASRGGGFYTEVYMSGTLVISDNYILDNNAGQSTGGFYANVTHFGRFYVQDNQVMSNTASSDNGGFNFSAQYHTQGRFDRNQVLGNRATQAGSSTGGGGFEVGPQASSTFYDNQFRDNRAGSRAGLSVGVYNSSSLTGDNLLVADNQATQDDSGGLSVNAGSWSVVDLANTVVVGNQSVGPGGGGDVRVYDYSTVRLSNALVQDNHALNSYAGGLDLSVLRNSVITATAMTVVSNTARYNGGGLYLRANYHSGIDLSQGHFTANTVSDAGLTYGGGGLYASWVGADAWLDLDGSRWLNNEAAGMGGGVFVNGVETSLLWLQGVEFTSNIAGMGGGGFYLDTMDRASRLQVKGSVFGQNQAGTDGGGIYLKLPRGSSIPELDDNQINDNAATGHGGGLYVDQLFEGAWLRLTNNELRDNQAADGGGCYVRLMELGVVADFLGNQFNQNSAGDDCGGLYLGAIIEGSVFHFWDNQVVGNQAGASGSLGGDYGGVYLASLGGGSQADLRNNQILSNTAYLAGASGGNYGGLAARLSDGSLLRLADNTLADNTAQSSFGGLSVELDYGSRLTLDRNLIQGNTAAGQSGGLYVYGLAGSQYFVRRNQILNNSAALASGLTIENGDAAQPLWGLSQNNLVAGNQGGGLYLTDADLHSVNDTIADNLDYGLMMTGTLTSTAYLSNTIVWGHTWPFTKTQALGYTDRFDMYATYSDIQGGWPGAGNIDADPLFVGGSDYHLQAASPAIDTVDPASAPAIDLDGFPRPIPAGGLADIGAYEWFQAGLTLTADQASLELPGALVTYTLSLTNQGNLADIFMLDVISNSLGWSAEITPSSLQLDAGASAPVDVLVSVPAEAAGGDSNQLVIQAVSTSDPAMLDIATLETTVVNVAGLELTPDQSENVAPDMVVRYEHTLVNGGNFADTIQLEADSSLGWVVELQPTLVNLPAGDSTTVVVSLTVPSDALAGLVDVTTVTASSSADEGLTVATATNTSTVLWWAGVEMGPDNVGHVAPGATITYTHVVTNIGNAADTFSLEATSSQNWLVSVMPASLSLAAGASAPVNAVVKAPELGSDGEVDLTTVRVASAGAPDVWASASDLSLLDNPADVSLTPNNAAAALVGTAQTYQHTLTNHGSATGRFDLSATSDQGWTVAVEPAAAIDLDPGQSVPVTVTVNLPASGANGLVDITLVEVTSDNGEGQVVATAADATTLLNPASILLAADQSRSAAPGGAVVYTHTLTTLGAGVDTLALATASGEGWVAQPSQDEITLQPGQSVSITVQVQVPADATIGTVDVTTLTVTSAYGPAAQAINVDTTTVRSVQFEIYLPVVVRGG